MTLEKIRMKVLRGSSCRATLQFSVELRPKAVSRTTPMTVRRAINVIGPIAQGASFSAGKFPAQMKVTSRRRR
jgi:hypothetical protein